eukprot:866987-Rhodomonas_salina.2
MAYGVLSTIKLAMRCSVRDQQVLLSAYAFSMPCPVLTQGMSVSAYALPMQCPVLTQRMVPGEPSWSEWDKASQVHFAIRLRACYAMSGTDSDIEHPVLDIAHLPKTLLVLTLRMLLSACARATSSPVLT